MDGILKTKPQTIFPLEIYTVYVISVMGDTVNVALMVEKMGEGMKIHMSGTAKNQLEQVGGFRTEYRGILDMGQKLGQMETYWLLGPDKDYDMEMENLSN